MLLLPGCSQITILRVQELRAVQSRVDTLAYRLAAAQEQLYREQKQQAELMRVVRADMQVRFGELAQRMSEIVGAKWEEVDLEAGLWTIPRERMKLKSAQEIVARSIRAD